MHYVYLWTVNEEPIYVGVGCNEGRGKNYARAFSHLHCHANRPLPNKLRSCEADCHIIAENLDRECAFLIEIDLIATLGRKDLKTGPLLNMTAGGDGCLEWAEEAREAARARRLGQAASEQTKAKMSAKRKGVRKSEEHRIALSKAKIGVSFAQPKLKKKCSVFGVVYESYGEMVKAVGDRRKQPSFFYLEK